MEKRKSREKDRRDSKRLRLSPSPQKELPSAAKQAKHHQTASPATSKDERAPDGLTLANATAIMSGYIGSLRNNLTLHNAVYEVTTLPPPDKGFACTVTLPENSPVREASSTGVCNSKQAAKASAAYHALCDLYAKGEISSSLELTPKNPTKSNRGGSGGAGSSSTTKSAMAGTQTYPYVASPRFWEDSPPLTKHVFGSVVELRIQGHPDVERQCRQLLLVTAAPMDFTTPTDIDISQAGVDAHMTFHPSHPLKLSGRRSQLEKGFKYTLSLLRSAHSRLFEAKQEETKYLILPLNGDFNGAQANSKNVDWDEIEAVQQPGPPIVPKLPAEKLERQLVGKVVCNDNRLKLRYYVGSARPDLLPTSPHPGVPGKTIRQVFAEGQREEIPQDAGPAVFEAERYVGPRLFGVVGSLTAIYQEGMDAKGPRQLYILPGGQHIHPISASTFRTTSVLAEALAGLDAHLLAIELSHELFTGPEAPELNSTLVRQAITSPSARPIAGTDNYERLELLGDTLLKFLVGVDVYIHGSSAQGEMSQKRHDIVSNEALRKSVIKSGIPPFIRARYRSAKDFVPPGWHVERSKIEVPTEQSVGDKVLADVCEALIAAAYLSCERKIQAALDAMHVLHIPLRLESWSDLQPRPVPPGLFPASSSTQNGRKEDGPLTLLGYTFKDPRRGRIALSMSHQQARRAEFERYEFLGDALLDYLTVDTLWDEYPSSGPGPLTHMKHSRVGNAAFSAYLAISGLIDQLTDVGESTVPRLKRYTDDIFATQHRADELIAAKDPEYEFWASVPEYKALGDALEAIIGAIFDDSGFDLQRMRKIYAESLLPFVRKYAVPPHGHSLHPRSALLEIIAKRGCRQFELVNSVKEGSQHQPRLGAKAMLHGVIAGQAVAATQALAARNACAEALRYIRRKRGIEELCDCKK